MVSYKTEMVKTNSTDSLLKWMWVVGQWFAIEVIVPKYWVTLVFVFISWLFRKSLFSKSEIVDKLFLFSCSQLWWHWKWVCISNDFQISFHTHGRESGDIANTGHLWGYNDTPTTEPLSINSFSFAQIFNFSKLRNLTYRFMQNLCSLQQLFQWLISSCKNVICCIYAKAESKLL